MITDIIIDWNNKWRFDYWYRQKYNIAFNSPEHRSLSPIDIKINFIEESVINRDRDSYISKQKDKRFYDKTGQWLKKIKRSDEEEKALFDLIDFRDYGTKKD